MQNIVAANLAIVTARIRAAERATDRTPNSVHLLAVSKTKPLADIEAAAAAGQRAFGENYAQEAVTKAIALAGRNLEWHFIGPVQANKTRDLATHMHWVHTLERAKIARRLNDQRPDHLAPLNVCLQVNISGEASKAGLGPSDLSELAHIIAELPKLRLRGLMAIPAPATSEADQRAPFRALTELFVALQQQHPAIDTLSMGMSSDLEAAVTEGATLVRVGTDIFGAR